MSFIALLTDESKLEEASRTRIDAKSASKQHDAQLRDKAQHFNEQQAHIDTELKNFTRSDRSGEAVHKFESFMNKLERLDVASGYLDLVKEVDELRFVIIAVAFTVSTC